MLEFSIPSLWKQVYIHLKQTCRDIQADLPLEVLFIILSFVLKYDSISSYMIMFCYGNKHLI